MNSLENDYKMVVATGGPCWGKSELVKRIKSSLHDQWIHLLTQPEAATHLFSNVWIWIWWNQLSPLSFQEELIHYQNTSELMLKRIASEYRWKTLVLLDRSVLDSWAYVSYDDFNKLLTLNNIRTDQLLSRYDGVIHMVTAANGAEDFYTLENNQARTETVDEAKELDQKIQSVYSDCSRVHIVDNSSDFDFKISMAASHIADILEIPKFM